MRHLITTGAFIVLLVAQLATADFIDITVKVADGELAGSMLLPDGHGPWSVVLILTGSGPTDRDGNQFRLPGKNNSLKQLAEGLARHGVASLRTDKRGVGGSASAVKSEAEMRFGFLVGDARQWINLLQADDRFTSVTVAGHSQGAQVGMNAAWLAGADGFVSLAGPGRPILTILREQLRTSLSIRSRVKANAIIEELEAGRLVPEPPTELTILFRPSVQDFLISWQRSDPVKDLARLSCPVAIVQGLNDLQVTEQDARLLFGAKPTASLLLLQGINHLFKPVEGDNPIVHQMSLTNPELTFSAEAVDAVVALTDQADDFHETWNAALDRALAYNEGRWPGIPAADFFQGTGQEQDSLGERLDAWIATRAKESKGYKFGLAEGGYVAEGELGSGGEYDCVSFMYRTTELARSTDMRDSFSWALRTRFAGAHPDSVVGLDGRVNYDRPEHLDYSLDMIRSGNWGRDITAEVGMAVVDSLGTSRYSAGSFAWVPTEYLDPSSLQAGDIIWLVLNPNDKKARKLRQEYGLVIGHLGLMSGAGQDNSLRLFHAASKDLPGEYEGGRVVAVDLATYLRRVDRYAGVMVTRLEDSR